MTARCATCPVEAGLRCPGEHPPGHPSRLCRLADPSDPLHDPAYRESIPEAARQLGAREYPPLATRAGNLARSLWDWVVSGLAIATREERARRRAACAACPRWDGPARRCTLCGCQTDYKIMMRSEHCPDDPPRW